MGGAMQSHFLYFYCNILIPAPLIRQAATRLCFLNEPKNNSKQMQTENIFDTSLNDPDA